MMRDQGPLRPYLELIRPPALPSAPADSIAGLALATALGSAGEALPALWQVAAVISLSFLCYSAGMISNDLFDVEVDREERPSRPLPSGRAKVSIAWGLCVGAQLVAILIAFKVAGTGLTFAVTMTISATYLYNGCLKGGWIGALSMGLCRAANFYIGATLALSWAAYGVPNFTLAVVGTALYITALTRLSEVEVEGGMRGLVRWHQLLAMSFLPLLLPLSGLSPWGWGWLAVLITPLWLYWKGAALRRAGSEATGADIQGAVFAGIRAVPLLNMALCAGHGLWIPALLCALLPLPGPWIGKRFYAT